MIKFTKEMTIGEALVGHPRAKDAFAGLHLGGCSHCSVSEYETIEQVCGGYGVPVDVLLGTLNSLLIEEGKHV